MPRCEKCLPFLLGERDEQRRQAWRIDTETDARLTALRRKGNRDRHLILGNCDICKILRLDTEICHVDDAGCRASDRIAHDLALDGEGFGIRFSVQRQVAEQFETYRLAVVVVCWQTLRAHR